MVKTLSELRIATMALRERMAAEATWHAENPVNGDRAPAGEDVHLFGPKEAERNAIHRALENDLNAAIMELAVCCDLLSRASKYRGAKLPTSERVRRALRGIG